jgi:valacyclovir hydrolase
MGWFGEAGKRIHFEDEGSGVALVLLPGWGGSSEEMSFLRSALSTRFRIISVDLPGSGRSEPLPREYTPSYYLEDSDSILELVDSLDAAPAHVIGFSDGGEYALLMAAKRPGAVRSVLAWGAAGQLPADSPVPQWFRDLVDAPIDPFKAFSDYLKRQYGEEGARLMAQSVAEVWSGIAAAGGDISRSRAGEVACPVRLIVGEADPFAPSELVSDMAQAIPRGEVLTVPGTGHAVHHSHREWLVEVVNDWLGQVTPGP